MSTLAPGGARVATRFERDGFTVLEGFLGPTELDSTGRDVDAVLAALSRRAASGPTTRSRRCAGTTPSSSGS